MDNLPWIAGLARSAGNIWNPDTEISHLIYNMLNPEF